ncbi:glutathione S-transferase family protein [Bradyrhizobium sp. CCGUVB23]|uniref:glutathione S-transferase family protein n=1 Tax=Bradyrhizobium sp. CCGUVB23 TaxID=2949630 RepID=UPI0020B1B191|nr:glutathione S-transferase [Bradyrhizobium sp. CCGUVB23]MCP3464664.1 glutathione S-transferase [Bradyrhizobium sp. CCGUVB23]
MTDIILHHYETSPYSEKVRLGLGLKGLAWESVEIPVIMPKPDLTALTGGYRKTPVLQIGADIYCDSQLIMRELERRHPTPSFYPAGHGAADALAWWAEKTTFSPAVSIAFAKRPDALPEGFLEDRAKFSGRNIDPAAMMAAVPNLLDQLRAHFDWLNQILRPKYRSGRDDGGSTEPARSVARAFRLAESDADRRALILAGLCR